MKSKNIFILIIIIFAIIGFVSGIHYTLDYFHIILSWKDWLISVLIIVLISIIYLLSSSFELWIELIKKIFPRKN